ncbi:MAG: UDP-N-acetylmuramoyl-tripeptide--D-alanyl-D-alanine ligase [Micrococcales bacterium]|nr:MAG: UDP-N-acetylmuramoyl-tripeptide--D-alanyl-D-alanine ligase [Micrococcales bacterium]PIE27309.1 MAG: UDP-N-acetylmuramoyl-tripeptide--D-alanyl-D-alanine ligase [Micrococcales bacterium]
MVPLSVLAVAHATGGSLRADAPDVLIDGGVHTDSRLCGPGSLFVARTGESADGHDYVATAAAAGAVAALVQHPVNVPAGTPDLVQIQVPDTEVAFGQVARAVIDAAHPGLRVVAVTGSSGKTSTKDLLAHVFTGWAPTVAAPESYNSEIGVPLTVCQITGQTRVLVAEMGARGAGHLTYLTGICPPDVAVVLNVGHAHAGEFGGLDAVEQAKGELVEALSADGVAVLNLDDDRVARMRSRTVGRILGVSAGTQPAAAPHRAGAPHPHAPHPDADIIATGISLDDQGRASFTLAWAGTGEAHPVRLRLRGAHHVGNALAAAAAAHALGMPTADIAGRLSTAEPASRWRMEVTERADGVRIVNDAYNANPDSMAAALHALAAMSAGRRSWAVLGTMLELGDQSAQLHAQVGKLAARLGIDRILAVGAGAIAGGARSAGHTGTRQVADADAAFAVLGEQLASGDVVLFKSSRDSGLRWLGERVAGAAPSSAGEHAALSGQGTLIPGEGTLVPGQGTLA